VSKIEEILAAHGVTEGAKEIEAELMESYRSIDELSAKKARIEQLEAENGDLREQVGRLSDTSETEALKKRVAEYEAAEADRAEKEAEKRAREEFRAGFDEAVGGKKFANSFTRDSIFEQAFGRHKAFPDLSAKDILDGITSGADGVWANPQADPKRMPRNEGGAAEGDASMKTFVNQLLHGKE